MFYQQLLNYLYNQVFPVLGDFFGKMSSLAVMDYNKVIDIVIGQDIIPYVNLFTGELLLWEFGFGGSLIGGILTTLVLIPYGFGTLLHIEHLPFFIALAIYLVVAVGLLKVFFYLLHQVLRK